MKKIQRPSRQPSTKGYSLPSRTARRNTLSRRILRFWREMLAVIFIVVVVATVIIVVYNREDGAETTTEESWVDRIHVSGSVGWIPTLSLSGPVSVASSKMIELEASGHEITADSPLIVYHFVRRRDRTATFRGRTRTRANWGVRTARPLTPRCWTALSKDGGSRVLFAAGVVELIERPS